ncbi:hypothetical protein HBI26_142990 [Parastagonospora nodorum]|nr:hypothetical protein HBI26_142990 [Parastagonospora nodorum]
MVSKRTTTVRHTTETPALHLTPAAPRFPRIFPTGFPQRSDVADSFLLTAHWQLLPAAATPSLVPLLHPCMAYSPCLAHTPRTPALFTRQDLRSQLYPRSIHPPACAVANTPSPHI